MPKKATATKHNNTVTKEKSKIKNSYYEAVGRRKEARARVRLYVIPGSQMQLKGKLLKNGEILINEKPIATYFVGDVLQKKYILPFKHTDTIGRFGVSALIEGGGLTGQMDAFILGCARALEKVNKETYRPILKQHGFLTRDPREKERRKAGFAQKARAKKQSPKR